MAVFSKLVTTEKGRALIARMISDGEKITFTKVCSSDMAYEIEELGNLEELVNTKQTGSISKVSRTNDIAVKVETVFTNTELTTGYNMKTIALYAQGENGEEILYAAAVETSGNCFMPAFEGITVSGAYIQLVTTVSNTENVTLEVDNSVFATIGNLMELQEQIDSVSTLVGDIANAVNVNARKLEMLDRIGSSVYSDQNLGFTKLIPYGENTEVVRIPLESIKDRFDDVSYYLYTLENRGGNYFVMEDESDRKKILEGFLWVNLQIGQYTSTHQVVPIAPVYFGNPNSIAYAATVNMMRIYSRPQIEDIVVRIWPHIYEKVDGGFKQLEGNLKIDGQLTLHVYKLGKILASAGAGGTVSGGTTGGTSNYNALTNKPSINNVTLQGNLTSDQLGIGGDAVMTYEEALAALNRENEEREAEV